ncbi:AAA family ATPase [Chitiniphilus shinanonensis]|uniref:AAA family ATPase n=1 Tax=Chitiniphilus shinanonensis TaxID=553088 RepID=UPI00304F14F9
MMRSRIHLFGASGSGTTTLGKAICRELGWRHFDTDDFFWVATDPPYTVERPVEERRRALARELAQAGRWVVSGSLCGWGDVFIPEFELAVFVRLPQPERMARLRVREHRRFGDAILEGGALHQQSREFMEWAAAYDTSDQVSRNLRKHQAWLATLPCPVLELGNEQSVEASVRQILAAMRV